jgi:polygalacturonase
MEETRGLVAVVAVAGWSALVGACGGVDSGTSSGVGAGVGAGADAGAGADSSADSSASVGVDGSSNPLDASEEQGLADGRAGSDAGVYGACTSDPNLPPEPQIPPACATLSATRVVGSTGLPSEDSPDTSAIQGALDACASGKAVRLVAGGGNDAFLTGPVTVPSGVSLWVDSGVTLYGTRDPSVYGSASALITVTGTASSIVGAGIIDGQGGEPRVGETESFWDDNGSGGESPALIGVSNAEGFTLYGITLHNAPMFHVKLDAKGFVVWGVTIKTPSKTTNSAGTALTPSGAHNTDGVDPGEAASNGYIVCSNISDGDDHIAIKGTKGVSNVTIAHDHLLAGHGVSIGSEFQGGVSNVSVYDVSIDGTGTGLSGGSSNGIRIKSDPSRGGLVSNVTYSDVCTRSVANPILLTPHYSTATGSDIPQYQGITIRDFHALDGGAVTIEGYDSAHATGITLDNVVVDGITAADVTAQYADVTLGPGAVDFTPSGTGVTVHDTISGTSQPNDCAGKWVTF